MNKIIKNIVKNGKAPNISIMKNYQRIRKILDFLHVPKIKIGYEFWDYKVKIKNYQVPIRIFYPKTEKTHPVIIYFHGGGWVSGNVDSYTKICRGISENTNTIVISVDYRLAPENKFPRGLLDCYEVTKFILKNSKLFNITKDKIYLMGDSAGGNIAAAISLKFRNMREYIPRKQILIYPVIDGTRNARKYKSIKENENNIVLRLKQMNEYMELYKSKDIDVKNQYVSPILARNLKNQPDTLIITAQLDILRDEGEMYGKLLEKAGNKVIVRRMEDVGHGFLRFKKSPTMIKVYKEINEFIKGDEDE